MDITIQPGKLSGTITAIPSKSQAHRLLICSAFADGPTTLLCPETNQDIEATVGCLNALGASISRSDQGYMVTPVSDLPQKAVLSCGESGSTLRFLLPIVGALDVDATFCMEGRLPKRPLSPLQEEMERMGCRITRPTENTLHCCGKLIPGQYIIDGGVSSQFITGLLLAAPLMNGTTEILIQGVLESKPYVAMTQQAMMQFGIQSDGYTIQGAHSYHSPGSILVEGDWSNAAFFLTAKALGNELIIENLNPASPQGDRAIRDILYGLCPQTPVSAANIPDLIPILAVAAAVGKGAVFTHIRRLRLKESDRVASTINMITSLGGKAEASDDTLTVFGTGLKGGSVDSMNDHRIAMAAAIASTACPSPVTILDTQCTQKSYPSFWAEFARLGGNYEQHLR